MSKLIIHNQIGDDSLALDLVKSVVAGGKVSKSTYGEQYCFLSVFQTNLRKLEVYCTLSKSGTSTFWVSEDNQDGVQEEL